MVLGLKDNLNKKLHFPCVWASVAGTYLPVLTNEIYLINKLYKTHISLENLMFSVI